MTGAIVVLLLVAVLSATQPARGPEFDPPPDEAEAPSSLAVNADDLLVTLSFKPNRPGRNFVSLNVYNTRRPAPAPLGNVAIQLRAPGKRGDAIMLMPERLAEGRYQLAGDFMDAPGEWQVAVGVTREGMADALVMIPWTVLPISQTVARRPVLISSQPLAPWLNLAAAGLALIVIGGFLALRQRRPSSHAAPPHMSVVGRILHPLRKG